MHAVSVGEVLSAVPLVQCLRELYPKAPIFVSCTTVAGRELAENKLRWMVDGLFYAPIDYVLFVRRVLGQLRPALVVILETEIWPNLWRETKRSGARLVVVNGRISDRAFPRYKKLNAFFRAVLAQPDAILVQTELDRERYIIAGAPPERVTVGGNLKYDFKPSSGEIAPEIQGFLDRVQPSQIWIAASTMPPADSDDVDEDDVVIHAFRELAQRHPGLLLLHVPRRPERFDLIASKLGAAGLHYVRRSLLRDAPGLELPGVLLLDTIGELSRLFAIADVVFMGGTLARRGGHNILEPAFFGKPVVTGPHMENFTAIAAEFTAAGATIKIGSPDDLAPTVDRLLRNPTERERIGARAQAIAGSKRGVTGRVANELIEWYDRGLPQRVGSAWLAPLAAFWGKGVERDRMRTEPRRLAHRVVSIGNITTGGSGKTPLVQWLAASLRTRGLQPAILTRGYRRRTSDSGVVLAAGTECPVARTGDEAQIFVRSGDAHIGIGGNRYENGREIEEKFGADVFLLDDGMQHWRLARDADIVLIDALDPFGGCELLPRGRLREPLNGLSRATAFVITRTEPGLRTHAIEAVLREYNPQAPIFRARVKPLEWHDARTGAVIPLNGAPFHKVAGFCGLGNPITFLRTLEELGLETVFHWNFGDHHSYRSAQMFRLARRAVEDGAEALVTTEKDFLNFPYDLSRVPDELPLLWLKITTVVDDPEGLLDLVQGGVGDGLG